MFEYECVSEHYTDWIKADSEVEAYKIFCLKWNESPTVVRQIGITV